MSKKSPIQNNTMSRTQLAIEIFVSFSLVVIGLLSVQYAVSTSTGLYLQGEKTLVACIGLFVIALTFLRPIHTSKRLAWSLVALGSVVGLGWVTYALSSMTTQPFAGLLLQLASFGAGMVALLLVVAFFVSDAYAK